MRGKKHYKIPRHFIKLGAHLKKLRKKAGLTQRDVSLALGYSSAQFISNFERGLVSPPLIKLKKLQELYRADSLRLIELILDSQKEIIAGALRGKPH